jgi:hypothetical protein
VAGAYRNARRRGAYQKEREWAAIATEERDEQEGRVVNGLLDFPKLESIVLLSTVSLKKRRAGEIADKEVLHATLIASAQAVEHYEMTRYGALIAWARQLGLTDCANLLQQNLERGASCGQKAHRHRGGEGQRANRLSSRPAEASHLKAASMYRQAHSAAGITTDDRQDLAGDKARVGGLLPGQAPLRIDFRTCCNRSGRPSCVRSVR